MNSIVPSIETVTALPMIVPAMVIMGVLASTAGIAIVLAHEMWRGGALPVAVSLLPPQPATIQLVAWFRFDELFHLYLGFAVALGLYLTVHRFLAPAGGDRA